MRSAVAECQKECQKVWTTNAQKAVEEKGGEIQTNTEVTDI